jgi:hypothetical protein
MAEAIVAFPGAWSGSLSSRAVAAVAGALVVNNEASVSGLMRLCLAIDLLDSDIERAVQSIVSAD